MIRYLLLILLFCGCFSERKANKQFAKAVVAFPKIGAEFCANEFPVKDSIIKDTVLTTDTILIQGGVIEDTVIVNDTVRITIVKTLPAKVITNTVHIRDTIIRENTAALKSCEIDKSKTIDLLVKKTDEANKYKGQARTRGWWLWGLIAFLILVIGLNVYLRTKKIVK